LPHVDETYGHTLAGSWPMKPDACRQPGSLAQSERLICELEAADAVVIGTPMHNYTVPSVLKAWIDHVLRAHRSFGFSAEGKVGLLADRPVYVAVASGGGYRAKACAAARLPHALPGGGVPHHRHPRPALLRAAAHGDWARTSWPRALRGVEALLERTLPMPLATA
jgi:FMN-dependent NADH-azoreductase